jgi:hypothetical protein
MRSKNENVYGCLVLLLILPISALVRGFVLSVLWGWFILPVFESAPALTIVQAIGIAMVIAFLTYQTQEQSGAAKKDMGEVITNAIGHAVAAPLFTLAVGWIVYLFV